MRVTRAPGVSGRTHAVTGGLTPLRVRAAEVGLLVAFPVVSLIQNPTLFVTISLREDIGAYFTISLGHILLVFP
ncbi:hypothetical protein AB433_08715 [Croceicoccus naphthovorans]|uniref:Uncharacterized protein n=1 Tax=Croceicoccus naphthovorans TaxID=1348774 RepID=A0A0G3XHH7_9SPHN|nr:hypothetical protein AB433_08715 [Croceicoccus naphthovorans]